MRLYTQKRLPTHGWIHECVECGIPTAKSLRVIVLRRNWDSQQCPFCQRCYRMNVIEGREVLFLYTILKKMRVNDLVNAVLCS